MNILSIFLEQELTECESEEEMEKKKAVERMKKEYKSAVAIEGIKIMQGCFQNYVISCVIKFTCRRAHKKLARTGR